MNHLTPDELVEAVEGTVAPSRSAHLESCDVCRREVTEVAAILLDARAVDVPAPSPLFWERFSDRVRAAIAAEPAAAPRRPPWLQWPVLAPIAALALLVFALASALPRGSSHRAPELTVSSALDDVSTVDAAWALVSDLVGPLDVESAQEAGIATTPGTAERVALHMTTAEQLELVRLLREELGRPGG